MRRKALNRNCSAKKKRRLRRRVELMRFRGNKSSNNIEIIDSEIEKNS